MKKSVFEYDNYRQFLREFYLASKAENKNFSFRYFSRICGFKSSNFLNLVMKGESHIADENIDNVAAAMKLNKEESRFFKNLVLFNKGKNYEEKSQFAKELLRSKTYRKIHPMSESQYNYFAKWYLPVVRGLVGLSDFNEDPAWIARKVSPAITSQEAAAALADLEKLGLVIRESGRLIQANPNIATPDEVVSVAGVKHHRDMMKMASDSIERVPRDKRDLSTMTVGISVETAKKIKEMIQNFRKDIVDVISKDPAPDSVYQLSFYLFPLTRVDEKKGSS